MIDNDLRAPASGSSLAFPAEQRRSLPPPRTLPDEATPFHRSSASAPAVTVSVIDGARASLASDAFAIVDADGRPRADSTPRGLELLSRPPDSVNRAALAGVVADLTAPGASLYSHFLLDALPKLHALGQAGIAPEDIDTFLVNSLGAPSQRELLGLVGVDIDRVRVRNDPSFPEVLLVERLIHVSPVRARFFTPSWAIEFVRRLLAWEPHPAPSRRVYVSRSDAGRRRVVNEAELQNPLDELGFETVLASRLSVRELAALLAECECVVGPHGAGMVNVLFAPGGASVVELYSRHLAPECWLLSTQLEHSYCCLRCESPGDQPERSTRRERNQADLVVDPHRLELLLKQLALA